MITFPFTEAMPIQFGGPLPAESDVVIIGGGVIGVTTALFLARRNISVMLLEKGRIAAEQSSRNWGWIRQQGRDADELPIMVEARRLWQQLAEECGEDIGLRQTGVTYLARTDKEMDEFAEFVDIAEAHGVDTRLLNSKETADLIPGMAKTFMGGLITPSDMRAEPWVAVPALARLAAREGVTIVENCAARLLDLSAGRISGVWTECGRIATSNVLIAGGAWTSLFLRAHGVSIPQLGVRLTVASTEPMPEVHAGAATDEHIAFRREAGTPDIRSRRAAATKLHVGPDAFRHATKYLTALAAHPFGTRYLPAAPRGFPDAWSTPRKWDADRETPLSACASSIPRPRRPRCAPSTAGSRHFSRNLRRCQGRAGRV